MEIPEKFRMKSDAFQHERGATLPLEVFKEVMQEKCVLMFRPLYYSHP